MSAFTIKATDTNGQEATKQFELEVNSSWWTNMTWAAADQDVGSPPGSMSSTNYPPTAGVFSLEVTQPQDPGWSVASGISVSGQQIYIGPEREANIHIVIPVATGIHEIPLSLVKGATILLNEMLPGAGTYDFPVTIPASVGLPQFDFFFGIYTKTLTVAGNIQATVTLT